MQDIDIFDTSDNAVALGKDVTGDGLADGRFGGCYEPDAGMVVGRGLRRFGHFVEVVVEDRGR